METSVSQTVPHLHLFDIPGVIDHTEEASVSCLLAANQQPHHGSFSYITFVNVRILDPSAARV
jgi:hypothetical protein